MNVFLIIANIINLWYNIPQIIKTYRCKSTRDFSATFLFLRIIGNFIWTGYSIEVNSFQMLLNNIVTVLASVFISYYKIKEIISDYKKKYNRISNNHYDCEDCVEHNRNGQNRNEYEICEFESEEYDDIDIKNIIIEDINQID